MPVMLLLIAGPSVGGLLFMVYGMTRYAPLLSQLAVLVLIVVGVTGAAAVLGYFASRVRARRGRLARAMQSLSAQFYGQTSASTELLVRWLDAFWGGPYDMRYVHSGGGSAVAVLQAWEYPAAISLRMNDSLFLVQGRVPSFCRVHVAAIIPDRRGAALPASTGESLRWLDGAGFDVQIGPGGIIAQDRGGLLTQLAKEPGRARSLAPVLTRLVALGRAIGAAPASRGNVAAAT